MSRQVKLNMQVSLSPYSLLKANDVQGATDEQLATWLSFSSKVPEDSTHVGTAEITVTLHDHKEIVTSQVAALQQRKKHIQAEAQKHITNLEHQIQSLLALENNHG